MRSRVLVWIVAHPLEGMSEVSSRLRKSAHSWECTPLEALGRRTCAPRNRIGDRITESSQACATGWPIYATGKKRLRKPTNTEHSLPSRTTVPRRDSRMAS